jgi:pimeloyl-ACP methyl ester carboxylesterase
MWSAKDRVTLRSVADQGTGASVSVPPQIDGLMSDFAVIGNTRLHYWLGGDPTGPPVLLWHGFLGTGYVWRNVAPRLAEAGFAVLVPDMRGYGDSDKPGGTTGYDAAAIADEMRALVRTLSFGSGQPLTLVAHDMGAPPSLLWTAAHPQEISTLFYIEEPVVLADEISKIIAFNPQAMQRGSLWWWILPFAPGAPERLIVGNERAFLTWFYDRVPSTRAAIGPDVVDEYLRTFAGLEGVLGALGVYRATFVTMEQTQPLTHSKVTVPVIAIGGERALGARVGEMVSLVATNVERVVVPERGHFLPEEAPDEIVRRIRTAAQR